MSKRHKKMLVLAVTVMLLLALGVWLDAGRSHDIPAPNVSDFIPPRAQVADEDNAHTYFRKAAALLRWPTNDYEVYRMLDEETWNQARADELLLANVETLDVLQQALASSAYQPNQVSEWVDGDPKMIWSVGAGKLLALKTMQERRSGRREQAMQARFDLLRFGSLIATHPRCMVEYTAGLVTVARGLDSVARLLREPGTSEAELIRLADHLGRIAPLGQGLIAATRMEFAYTAAGIDKFNRAGEHDEAASEFLLQPNRTKEACAEYYRAVIAHAALPYYTELRLPEAWPARGKALPQFLSRLRSNSQGHALMKLFLLPPNHLQGDLRSKCRVQSFLDGVRLVVACRLYEMRHGRLPETFDALVPELLPEVPRDPFDGKPFRYLPKEAIVYTVGPDLKDAGGTGGTIFAVPALKNRSPKSDDIIFQIHGETH